MCTGYRLLRINDVKKTMMHVPCQCKSCKPFLGMAEPSPGETEVVGIMSIQHKTILHRISSEYDCQNALKMAIYRGLEYTCDNNSRSLSAEEKSKVVLVKEHAMQKNKSLET